MTSITPIEKVEIHVLVDNATDSLSTIPKHAESEFAYLERNGMQELSGDCLCCACHGLSLLITATRGEHRHTVRHPCPAGHAECERGGARLAGDRSCAERCRREWDSCGTWIVSGASR